MTAFVGPNRIQQSEDALRQLDSRHLKGPCSTEKNDSWLSHNLPAWVKPDIQLLVICGDFFSSPELDLMDLIGEDRKWMVGRKLMQVNDTLTSEDAGLRSSKNCTEPGNSDGRVLTMASVFFSYSWGWIGWHVSFLSLNLERFLKMSRVHYKKLTFDSNSVKIL